MRTTASSPTSRCSIVVLAVALLAVSPGLVAGDNVWTFLGPTTTMAPLRITVDPNNASVIYLSVGQSGAYRSTDGGSSWSSLKGGLGTGAIVYDLLVKPGHSSTLFAATENGVFKSTDAAVNWKKIASDSFDDLAEDPHAPGLLYAAAGIGGVSKSKDGGATWSQAGSMIGADRLLFDPVTPGTIYTVGGAFLVQKSTDGGDTWTEMLSGFPSDESANALALAPKTPSLLFAGTDHGLYRSTDGGQLWTPQNEGLSVEGSPVLNVYDIATDPSRPEVVYAATGKGVFKSVDGAGHWAQMTLEGFPGSPPHTSVRVLVLNPQDSRTLLAGITPYGICSLTQASLGMSPPVVANVRKRSDPFCLLIRGSNFQPGLTVALGGGTVAWPDVTLEGTTLIKLKGGKQLKGFFPDGRAVAITIKNPDGGETVAQFTR